MMRFSLVLALFSGLCPAFAAAPVLSDVVNASTFTSGTFASGEVASIFGTDLANATALPGIYPPPAYLGGATVYVNGRESPLLYVSPSQVNFQFPAGTPAGTVSVGMIVDNAVSNIVKVEIVPIAPTLFHTVLVSAFQKIRPARPGEYVSLYATGLTPGPVTASIGGIPATVSFADVAPAGPNPYTVGLYQINALVPDSVIPGDTVPVTITSQGAQSNTVTIAVTGGRSGSIAKFLELGPAGVIARAITSENTCPTMTVDGNAQLMSIRAAPSLPLYPVLTCEAVVSASAHEVQIEGQTLRMPAANPSRITVLGDTGCRMDTSTSQACYDPKAWPVEAIAKNAAASNPDLLIHNGDYHYRESICMIAGCAGSPWGYNWDVWREDLFLPFQDLLATAPWIFVRGNHESCERAGEGWFRFLDPRPMPAVCQVYTDPYSMQSGPITFLHLDSAQADDVTLFPDQVAAYVPQFDALRQMSGPNTWVVTHRPLWAIRSNLNANVVLQAASNNNLPSGVQVVLSGHTHTFQTYTFSPARAPQLVIGNSGDNIAAVPAAPLVGKVVGEAMVTDSTSIGGYGYSVLSPIPGNPSQPAAWSITPFDTNGKQTAHCVLSPGAITCGK